MSRRVTKWISDEVSTADAAAPPNPGHVVVRRLNRAEYNNTVRDLVGLDLRPADDFPQDDTGYGFDTIGAVLSLPPVLMEKYLVGRREGVAHGDLRRRADEADAREAVAAVAEDQPEPAGARSLRRHRASASPTRFTRSTASRSKPTT